MRISEIEWGCCDLLRFIVLAYRGVSGISNALRSCYLEVSGLLLILLGRGDELEGVFGFWRSSAIIEKKLGC